MEVPTYKAAEHEEIQAQIDAFFKSGKKTTKAKQGQIKEHLSKPYVINNKAKNKL